MANEWFRHDYNAHEDIKQKRLLKRHGVSALGFYWYLVELLYQSGGKMSDKDVRLEAELLDSLDYLDSFIEFELFAFENGNWICKRISDELAYKEEVRQKRAEAGRIGGYTKAGNFQQMPSKCQANAKENIAGAKQTLANSSTITFTNTNNKEEVELFNNNSPKKKVFVKPTLEEVSQYCRDRGNKVNPQAFIDFYESKGWMVGKNHMKDWKACVRTWEHSDRQTPLFGNRKKFTPTDITGRYDNLESEVIEV